MKKYLIFSLLAIFILSGCAEMTKKDKLSGAPSLLEPQAILKFSDIPVPSGFRLLSQESYSFESSGMRVGLLKYEGRVDVEQVVNFYKEQMAMYNWRLLNVVEYGERMLNFDRETETCIITLLPRGRNLVITLSVGPKAQSAQKAQKTLK